MKVNLDVKKVKGAVSDITKKTSDLGKKVSTNVQQKAKDISEKSKNDNYLRKLKKYNPLFPDKYFSEDFNCPNMIVIVDDAVRRGIDVCEGAIGWTNKENGMEVLYLYDEFVKECGIQFVPAVICDAVYYVDRFDRNRFVQIDCIFSKAHEERLAELKHIAYSLGAKRCSIEISESNTEAQMSKMKSGTSAKGFIQGVSVSTSTNTEQSTSSVGTSQRSGKIEAEFEGSNDVKMPKLKWFEHDETIKNLIEIRTEDRNAIKSEVLVLEGAVSATMSKKTAYAIDTAISKIGMSGKTDMEGQATKENHSKLIFSVEF